MTNTTSPPYALRSKTPARKTTEHATQTSAIKSPPLMNLSNGANEGRRRHTVEPSKPSPTTSNALKPAPTKRHTFGPSANSDSVAPKSAPKSGDRASALAADKENVVNRGTMVVFSSPKASADGASTSFRKMALGSQQGGADFEDDLSAVEPPDDKNRVSIFRGLAEPSVDDASSPSDALKYSPEGSAGSLLGDTLPDEEYDSDEASGQTVLNLTMASDSSTPVRGGSTAAPVKTEDCEDSIDLECLCDASAQPPTPLLKTDDIAGIVATTLVSNFEGASSAAVPTSTQYFKAPLAGSSGVLLNDVEPTPVKSHLCRRLKIKNQEAERLRVEKVKLEEKVAELEKERGELAGCLDIANESNENLHEQVAEQTRREEALEAENAQLKKQYKSLRKSSNAHREELEVRLVSAQDECNRLRLVEAEHTQLKEKYNGLESKFKIFYKESQEAMGETGQMTRRIEDAITEHNELKLINNGLQQDVKNLREDVEIMEDLNADLKARLETFQHLQARNEALELAEQERRELATRVQVLDTEVSDLTEKNANVEEQLKESRAAKGASENRIAELEVALDAAHDACTSANATASNLKVQNASFEEQLKESRANKDASENRIAELEVALDAANDACTSANATASELKVQIANVEGQLKESRADKDASENRIAELEKELEAAHDACTSSNATASGLKVQNASFEEQLRESRAAKDASENRIAELGVALDAANDACTSANATASDLKVQNVSFEEQLKGSRAAKEAYENRIAELEKELEAAKDESALDDDGINDEDEPEVETLRRRVKSLNQQLEKAKPLAALWCGFQEHKMQEAGTWMKLYQCEEQEE